MRSFSSSIRPVLFLLFGLLYFTSNAQPTYDKKKGKIKTESPDGTFVGRVENYKPEGEWILYYPAQLGKNKIKKITHYSGGWLNGAYCYYSSSGVILEKGTYLMERKNGNWVNYWPGGRVRSSEFFINDTLDGEALYYYTDCKPSSRYVYTHGKVLAHEMWASDGTPQSATYYNSTSGEKEGRCWENYSGVNGDTSRKSYCDYKNGLKQGEQRISATDGSYSIFHWKAGVRDGEYSYTRNNGKTGQHGFYDMGFLVGECYYASSDTTRRIEWFPAKKDSGFFYDGKMHEIPDSSKTYINGHLTSSERNLVRYKNIMQVTEYDFSGRLTAAGMERNDRKDSTWTTYYPQGKISSIVDYHYSITGGDYKVYYPNGKLMIKTHCMHGWVDTTVLIYDQK